MFVVTVKFILHAEHRDAFEAAVIENARLSLANEPGCHRFDVCRGPQGDIFLYELYDDEAAFKTHMTMPHFLEFDAMVASWTADKEVGTYTLVA